MAQENLNVKFKIDTSEVKAGADEAKNKVKQTAQSMEGDVKKASASMSNSLKEISRSTDQIGQSARKATSDLGTMEGQLKNVSKQMSAMQAFHMGARGVGMLGGVASNILKLQGDYEGAENVDTLSNLGQGAFQGAAMGFAVGGGWGAAIGALAGAGSALLEAAVKQKEAAEATLAANRDVIENAESQNQDRILGNWASKTANAKDFDMDFAEDQINAAKERIKQAQADLNDALDIAKGRISTQYTGTSFQVDGKTLMRGQDFGNIDWTDKGQTARLEEQLGSGLFKYVHDLVTQNVKDANKELADATKELAILAPLQERIAREKAKIANLWNKTQSMWGYSPDAKAFDDYQKGEDVKDRLKKEKETLSDYQSQLKGVSKSFSTPTDALTRMGGGRGYTSYNNSTAQVQARIETNLKTLISNQKAQVQQLVDQLKQIQDGLATQDPFATWAPGA